LLYQQKKTQSKTIIKKLTQYKSITKYHFEGRKTIGKIATNGWDNYDFFSNGFLGLVFMV
jgi:hypothetical protein